MVNFCQQIKNTAYTYTHACFAEHDVHASTHNAQTMHVRISDERIGGRGERGGGGLQRVWAGIAEETCMGAECLTKLFERSRRLLSSVVKICV